MKTVRVLNRQWNNLVRSQARRLSVAVIPCSAVGAPPRVDELLSGMSNLAHLSLGPSIHVTDALLDALGQNSKLISLKISGIGPLVSPRGGAVRFLGLFRGLEDLHVGCFTSDNFQEDKWWLKGTDLSEALRGTPGLKTLTLTGITSSSAVEHLLWALQAAPGRLEELRLCDCVVAEGALSCLGVFTSLRSISVEAKNISSCLYDGGAFQGSCSWGIGMLIALQRVSSLRRLSVWEADVSIDEAMQILPGVAVSWTRRFAADVDWYQFL